MRSEPPSSLANAPPESDGSQRLGASVERFVARVRIAGAALAASVLVPCATAHDGPLFVGLLAPDLGSVSLRALLAPAVCGTALLVGSFACRRAVSLALIALASLSSLFLVTAAGAEALAWDGLPAPAIWSWGTAPGLLAVALTAAAVNLYPVLSARRVARRLLAAAALCSLSHLALPVSGEAPLLMTARVVAYVASGGLRGNLISASLLSLVVLWPGMVPVAGWVDASRRASSPRDSISILVVYGFPALLAPVARTTLTDPGAASPGAAVTLGGVAILGAVLLALGSTVAFLAERAASANGEPLWPALRKERGAASVAIVLLALAVVVATRPARPSSAIARLRVGSATPEGDSLFGTLLPGWNDARARLDLGDPARDPAALPDVAAAETSLLAAARHLDIHLGDAIEALVSDVARPPLRERRWYRRVDAVNEASWRAGLPYYVDPTEIVATDADPPRRWFRLDTYRVESVHHFTSGGAVLSTLHLRASSPGRARPSALGISRDLQPFAVVVVDELHAYEHELELLAAREPPRCGEGPLDTQAAEDALRACGERLARLVRAGQLGDALLLATDRHEIQHQIDGPNLPRSARLERLLTGQAPESRARVAREVSAYLAQMTVLGTAPGLTLLRLLRMALLLRRSVEQQVALRVMEALDGAEASQFLPREAAARAYGRLADLTDDALRARAASAWRELFGRSLPAVAPEP